MGTQWHMHALFLYNSVICEEEKAWATQSKLRSIVYIKSDCQSLHAQFIILQDIPISMKIK